MSVSQNVARLVGNDTNVFEFDCTINIFEFGCKILVRRNSGTIIRSIMKNKDGNKYVVMLGKNASVGEMTTEDRDDQYEVLGM